MDKKEKLNVRVLACYLISLFYKTGCKYSCNRSKINKLLTIYMFCNVNNVQVNSNEKFYITNSWFGFLDSLSGIRTEEYSVDVDGYPRYAEPKMADIYVSLLKDYEMPEDSKKLLDKIFENFGKYSNSELAEMLNGIKENIPYKTEHPDDSVVFDLDEVVDYFKCYNDELKNEYRNNEVVSFINDYHKNNILNLKGLIYYLISLFYKTDGAYSCYRAKINRLLTIYLFCDIENMQNKCTARFGISSHMMGFPLIFDELDRYPIANYGYYDFSDTKQYIDKNLDVSLPDKCDEREKIEKYGYGIPEYSKVLLEKIFRRFGSYPNSDLSSMIEEFHDSIPHLESEIDHMAIFDVDKLIDYFKNYNGISKNNEVFNFLHDYHLGYSSKDNYIELAMEEKSCDKSTSQTKSNKQIVLEEKNLDECDDSTELNNSDRLIKLVNMLDLIEELAELENKTLDDVINLSRKRKVRKK